MSFADDMGRDLRLSFRSMRRSPGTTVVAAIALALGLGLTTMVFSIIWGVIVRGLPFDEPEELVRITRTLPSRGFTNIGVSIPDLFDWRTQQRSFEDMAGFYTNSVSLSDDDLGPERYSAAYIEPVAFRLIGVEPQAGRMFTDEENRPGAPRVAVLAWGLWQQRFGGGPDIVGRAIRVNGEETLVLGIMPRGFAFPENQDLWLPLKMDPARFPRGQPAPSIAVFGRLRDGVDIAQAGLDIERIAQRLAAEYPETNEGIGARVFSFTENVIDRDGRNILFTMFGAVVFVLLIACVNVTNLLMARALARSRDIAVRTAMGASRWRIISQFLAESLSLALAGALAGTIIAAIGIRLFNAAIADIAPPFWIDIRIDGAALGFAFAAMLAASLLSGLWPAVQAARAKTGEILKDESRGGSSFRLGRLSRILVAGEIALSVGLLVGAGLMIRSVVKLRTVDIGFDAARVYTARLGLAGLTWIEHDRRVRFAEELLARLRASPGFDAVALSTSPPGLGTGATNFAIEGATYLTDRDYPVAMSVSIADGFFDALDVQLVNGRAFTPADRDGALPVIIVNRAFERRFFPEESALGKRIRPGPANSTQPWATIIGVAPDLYPSGVENRRPEAIYQPMLQTGPSNFSILARTRTDPSLATPAVRSILREMNPDIPIYDTGSLEDVIQRDNWQYGIVANLFGAFGLAALFLASVGLYGVMSFSVSRRTRELGVRMALGATTRDILRLIFRQGLGHTGIGLAVGTVFALAVSRVMSSVLFDVKPRDPITFAAVVTVLLATSVVACFVPARRASAVDPLEAMRVE